MKKCPKVIVCVRGGNVEGVIASTENIAVEVFDVDNLKAEGKTDKVINEMWDKTFKECRYNIY